jgi:hypothetical protein
MADQDTSTDPRLSDDEQALLQHIMRWGSDGYPVKKVGSHHWAWGPWRGINGPPVVFPRRRDAVASFEAYIDILCDKKAGRL